MVQGTQSHVGKSFLTAALCRLFAREGWRVAPFKAQNMALNSYVTADGGEIGRSQAVQAAAAGIRPSVEMNPILLKPQSNGRSQVIVMGRPSEAATARAYQSRRDHLWPIVTEALATLRAQYDLVVIEGAGGAAEINLRDREIVNMRVARHADAPVLLVGDIERGGVFAALLGTLELLEPAERALVRALVINKFHGDISLLGDGAAQLSERCGVPVAGVLPFDREIALPEEDSVALSTTNGAHADGRLDVVVIRVPHIANFDDFDPLDRDAGVSLRYAEVVDALGDPDLIVLPGTKSTIADVEWLHEQGIAAAVLSRYEAGTPVIGICGGFQMLGGALRDPLGVESEHGEATGLGILPCSTTFREEKATHQVVARVLDGSGLLDGCAGMTVRGYEIHMGVNDAPQTPSPIQIDERSGQGVSLPDGATDAAGRAFGTYIHGILANDEFRARLLSNVARLRGRSAPAITTSAGLEAQFDRAADLVHTHLDMELVRRITGLPAR